MFQLLDDAACLVVVVLLLSDDDAMKAVRFSGRRYASFARLLVLRPRPTAPVDGVEGFVVLRVQKAIVRQQRLSALSSHEIEFLIFKNNVDGASGRPIILELIN